MFEYIAWYAVELRSRLAPALGIERADEIVSEAQSHLRESSAAIREQSGCSLDEAELRAVQAFGTPEVVAAMHLRHHPRRLWGMMPVWVVLAAAATMVYCWDYPWMTLSGPFDNFGEPWLLAVAAVAGMLALVAFVAGVRAGHRSYRWQVLGLAAAICGIIPPLLSAWMISTDSVWDGVSRLHVHRDEAHLRTSLKGLDSLRRYYERAIVSFGAAKKPSDLSPEFYDPRAASKTLPFAEIFDFADQLEPVGIPNHGYRLGDGGKRHFAVPRDVWAMVDGRIFGLSSTSTPMTFPPEFAAGDTDAEFRFAKSEWTQHGLKYLKSIDDAKEHTTAMLGLVGAAEGGRVFFVNKPLILSAEAPTILFVPVLLVIDGITHILSRRRRYWPRARALA